MREGIRMNFCSQVTSFQWFTESYLESCRKYTIDSRSIRKKKSCHKPILWLIHVCTHSYIYSNILFFNKCTLMKTTTSADGCLIQLKVLTWIYSWLFFFWQFHHCEALKQWGNCCPDWNSAKEEEYLLKWKLWSSCEEGEECIRHYRR